MALTQSQQLDLFKEYKVKLEAAIGKERTDDLVSRAGYLVSSGTNDFTFNYYGPIPIRRTHYPTIEQYKQFQWQKVEEFLEVCHFQNFASYIIIVLILQFIVYI